MTVFLRIMWMSSVVALLGMALFWGRSCSRARPDQPVVQAGEVVWVVGFNGL